MPYLILLPPLIFCKCKSTSRCLCDYVTSIGGTHGHHSSEIAQSHDIWQLKTPFSLTSAPNVLYEMGAMGPLTYTATWTMQLCFSSTMLNYYTAP